MGGPQVNLSIVLIRIRRTAPKWFAHTQALCFPHTSQLWGSVGCGSSSLLRRSVAERSARAVPCCGATMEFGADHGQFPLWDWTKTQRHQKTEFSFSRWLGWGPPICRVALLHVPKHPVRSWQESSPDPFQVKVGCQKWLNLVKNLQTQSGCLWQDENAVCRACR